MKNNRLLVFIILSSFFIYSCASTKSDVNPKDDSLTETPEITDTVEILESDTKETNEIIENTTNEISEEIENQNTEDDNTKNAESKKDELEIPEEIIEPVIRDLPIPDDPLEEIEISTTDTDEKVSLEEPITEIDTLEPIEPIESIELIENQENLTETEENPETNLEDSDDSNIISEENTDEDLDTDSTEDSDSQEYENEEESENDEDSEEFEEVIEEIVIIPSRSVTLRKGENLEVIYPGSGWIYMGSLDEYNNLASRGRKLGATDTKYTLLAKEAGTQIHHFYKVDNLTGMYIDDYIEVTVLEKKGSSKTTITAPAYSEIIPERPELPAKASVTVIEKSEEVVEEKTVEKPVTKTQPVTEEKNTKSQPAIEGKTANIKENSSKSSNPSKPEGKIESSELKSMEFNPEDVISEEPQIMDEDDLIVVEEDTYTAVQNIDTDELLDQAQILFNEKQYAEANKLLVDFFEYSFTRIDEALYLQGQILEADSEIKDVKTAIQSYEALVKNYPASTYWNDANKRIKYLRKFYYISN